MDKPLSLLWLAACCTVLPRAPHAGGVAACVGPQDVPGLTEGLDPNILRSRSLSLKRPRLARFVWGMMGIQARYAPKRLIAQGMRSFSELDRAVMAARKSEKRLSLW